MSRLQQTLGYGQSGSIELEYTTRLFKGEIYDTEEVRRDTTDGFADGYEYLGIAALGTPTDTAEWYVLRITWINNTKTRFQGQRDISWDNRTQGWV